jgi:hypothetical protein
MLHTQHPIEILRFNTCGAVDDGKPTLVGWFAANRCVVSLGRTSDECQTGASHSLSLGERVGVRGNRLSNVLGGRNRL